MFMQTLYGVGAPGWKDLISTEPDRIPERAWGRGAPVCRIRKAQNFRMMGAVINSIGVYCPERVIYNSYFEKYLDTSDSWIRDRTGIEKRHFSAENEYTSDLCIKAGRNLQERYGKNLEDVDFIIVATMTPDHTVPNTASRVQAGLGIRNAGAVDISTACSGFCYGLVMAKGLISAGTHRKILVFGADTMSKVVDFSDRNTCILFGDGAGAVLVESSEDNGLFEPVSGTDGDMGKEIYVTGSRAEINGTAVTADGKFHQNGRAVYKWALGTLTRELPHVVRASGLEMSDISCFLPHSANYRMLEAAAGILGIPLEKCAESVRKYANTSAATIPLAWNEAVMSGMAKKDDILALLGFGGGLTYAGLCVRNDICRPQA